MNAYQLYDAVFDTARDTIPTDRAAMVLDIIAYADGAFDLSIDRGVVERIADARLALVTTNEGNGEWENNHWQLVERPLSEIELAKPLSWTEVEA